MKFSQILSIALLVTSTSSAFAADIDPASVPEKKRTKLGLYVSAQQAYDQAKEQSEKVLFVDVRTRAEINFLGTPVAIDANVPYMELNEWYAWNEKSDSFKLEVNSDFAATIEKRLAEKNLGKTDKVILLCRSGDRSAKAADLLADLGYTQVYSVVDGFEGDMSKEGVRNVNGWKNAGLPWSYKLAKTKMYFSAEQ